MRNTLNNEKGIALITTLMFLGLGFAVVAILLRLVTAETKMARLEQSYSVALDAAKGGADEFMFLIQNNQDRPPDGFGTAAHSGWCFKVKKSTASTNWLTNSDWTANSCTNDLARATSPDPTVEPDFTMALSNYTVYVKVIDTTLTEKAGAAGEACADNGCAYYTVNVRAVSPNSNERAEVSFVFRYDRES
jgi:Tfp pilus assembly protein PilX